MKEYTKLAKETSNPPFSVFVDAYKKGLISKNRLAIIRNKYNEIGCSLKAMIDYPEQKEEVELWIKGATHRLQKRADEIYNIKREVIPIEQREYLTVHESVAFAKEKGYSLSATSLYNHERKNKIQKYFSTVKVIYFAPKDVISLCKDIEASRSEIKRPAILDKLKDETLIEEIKRRGYKIG